MRHSSLKPTQQGSSLVPETFCQPSVKFAMHEDSSNNLRSVNSNLAIAKEGHFNQRYGDYVRRVDEVNKAKDMLKSNRE